jgi:large subunit ribosomal protein L9
MNVILLHDVDKLGRRGETVAVSNGYARNFLFPKSLAVRADTAKKKELETRLKAYAAKDDRDRRTAEELAQAMREVSVNIPVAASEEGTLYGSVTAPIIAGALREKGHEVETRQIELEEPLKALGSYTVPLRLHRDVAVEVKVWIERS